MSYTLQNIILSDAKHEVITSRTFLNNSNLPLFLLKTMYLLGNAVKLRVFDFSTSFLTHPYIIIEPTCIVYDLYKTSPI